MHIIGGQRSVRIAPPSLSPHHSGPATRDFQSSISVEALFCRVIWMCRASFTNNLVHAILISFCSFFPDFPHDCICHNYYSKLQKFYKLQVVDQESVLGANVITPWFSDLKAGLSTACRLSCWSQ